MTAEQLYAYSQSGRRPLTIAFAIGCAAMAMFGLWNAAPWYFWPPVVAANIGMGWLLVANPQSGSLLTRDTLRFFHGKLDRTIKVADIVSVKRHIWSDGPDDVTLTLVSGETIELPSQSISRGFIEALRRTGVAGG